MEPDKKEGPDEEAEEELTPEQIQKFNEICKQASELAQDYQRQSEELKSEITSMVQIYNKNQSPEQAVPVDKIIQITQQYQEGMKEVQSEYSVLSKELKKEEQQRNDMMGQIQSCFDKLQRMEKVLMEKKRKEKEAAEKKAQEKKEQKVEQVKNE